MTKQRQEYNMTNLDKGHMKIVSPPPAPAPIQSPIVPKAKPKMVEIRTNTGLYMLFSPDRVDIDEIVRFAATYIKSLAVQEDYQI